MAHDLIPLTGNNSLTLPGLFAAQSFNRQARSRTAGDDIIRTIRDNIQYIGHFHTGGVPDRHELDDTQELQWRTVAKAIADLNFQGYFAHEFVPVRDPMTWLRQAVELCTV